MKLNEIKTVLSESRKPELKYTEKKVRDKIERVTVALEGNESGVMSRLVKKYKDLDDSLKELNEKRDEVNEKVKETLVEMFDAEDAVLTRVVETVSFTITLSKAEPAASKTPKATVDYAKIVAELLVMVPELKDKVDALTEQYTTFGELKDTPAKLTVKINEGVFDKIKNTIVKFYDIITSWTVKYDNKLNALKVQLDAIK